MPVTSNRWSSSRYNTNNAWNYNNNGLTNNNNFYNSLTCSAVSEFKKQGMVRIEDLYIVYKLARANKRRSEDAVIFELSYEKRLRELCRAINERTYRAAANYTFIADKPKPREVFGCELEARIIQWYIVWRIKDILEDTFTTRTFNNRIGMGTDRAIQQVRDDIREVSRNYTRDAYIIQWDLQGYFPNADCDIIQEQLQDLVRTKYEGEDKDDLLWMIMVSVNSNPQMHCYRKSAWHLWEDIEPSKSLFSKPEGKGAAIGFLIFQTAMNLYLDKVDHWAVDEMGLHYTRFVDDTIIVVENKECALTLLPKIRGMYAEVGATMHPRKFYCQHYSKGLHFLGSYIKYDRVYLSNRTIRRAEAKVRQFNADTHKQRHIEDCIASLNSYFGIMKNKNEVKTIFRLYDLLSQSWRKYIHLDYDRLCLVANDGYKHNDIIKNKFYEISK